MRTSFLASRPIAAACLGLVLALGLVVGGCKSPRRQPKAPEPTPEQKAAAEARAKQGREFYLGTRAAQQDIRDLFARVEGAAPHQWAEIASKLVAYGEPAVPQMMANLSSHQTGVAVMSAYTLGMIQDPRSLDALAQAVTSPHEQLRYEAATSMLRMGDPRGLPFMIDALENDDPLVRARAILVLRERTGNTMGFVPDGKPEDRLAAVSRWRAWLARGGGVRAPRPVDAGASTR